ncbi:myo-inositol 2-dehydrogenase-like protein [Microdochium nivale]|nr:myo-inositol 2-dehydrogenase-like protein [Microdochium nivale]
MAPANSISAATPADAPVDYENLPPATRAPSKTGSKADRARRSSDTNDQEAARAGTVIKPPPPPPMSASPPRVLVIGAGSRGRTYARCTVTSCNGVVAGVVEPDDYKRRRFGEAFIWGDDGDGAEQQPPEGSQFRDWTDFISWEKERRERVAERTARQQQRLQSGDVKSRNDEDDDNNDPIPEGVDAVFVCVRDELHHDVVMALAPLGLHIMCEKPLATTLDDCVGMYRALAPHQDDKIFSVCHVLRYSPHNMMLRSLLFGDGKNGAELPLDDPKEEGEQEGATRRGAIGEILSIHHTEPVGWWHFAHSYVRGNWRRESVTAPSLLTKSCHDIDLLLWLLCSPPPGAADDTPPHLPATVSSSGALQFFKKSRKPRGAGKGTTNCLSCPVEPECMYSSKRIYVGGKHAGLETGNVGWPLSIVMPDIESFDGGGGSSGIAGDAGDEDSPRKRELLKRLAEDYDASTTPDEEVKGRNWFGRCVFESDNDVCDEQTVTMTWDEELSAPMPENDDDKNNITAAAALPHRGAKQATFHMIAQTKRQCQRYTHVYGTEGEIYADSWTITVEDFRTGKTHVYTPRLETLGHGGGDVGLARQFIMAVDKVKNHGWGARRAQREFIGCTLEEVVRSHAMVFAAEEARRERTVVDWHGWWNDKVGCTGLR